MKLKNKSLTITCDGGAATGKSTGAKLISKKYKLAFLSSGLLYRYASYLILKHKPKNIIVFLKKKFKNLDYKKLYTINLHTDEISNHCSNIAKILKIRNILKIYQKNFIRKNKSCVLEGRDASTKILPSSDIKFFFTCNINIAAKRRYKELKKKSNRTSYSEVKTAIYKRNKLDRSRRISPLQKHPDAVVVNTSNLDRRAMIVKMSVYIDKFLKKYGDRRTDKK